MVFGSAFQLQELFIGTVYPLQSGRRDGGPRRFCWSPKVTDFPVTNVIVHVPFVTACSRVHWVSETFLVRLHEVLLLLWLGQRKHCSASGPTYHGGRGVAASGFSSHCLVGNIWKPWVVRIVRLWLLGSSGCPVFFLKHIRITVYITHIYIIIYIYIILNMIFAG